MWFSAEGGGVKRLFIIRHAKSSWSDAGLADFDRPLNKRGKRDAPVMAGRLERRQIVAERILASPAKRARKTAIQMARASGYEKENIVYLPDLYFGSVHYCVEALESHFKDVDTIFLVGHNPTVTELAEYLSGEYFANVPTCGIVAIGYEKGDGFSSEPGVGKMLFFDYPKKEQMDPEQQV